MKSKVGLVGTIVWVMKGGRAEESSVSPIRPARRRLRAREAARNEHNLSQQLASAGWYLCAAQDRLAATPRFAANYKQVLEEYRQAEIFYNGIVAGAVEAGRRAFEAPASMIDGGA